MTSDKPISVGDLVEVVKPRHCNCPTDILGAIRRVVDLRQAGGMCPRCGDITDVKLMAILDGPAPWGRWHIQPYRLKRIPPLEELEREKLIEKLPELIG